MHQDPSDPVAWSALLMGLTMVAVGLGALRRPGLWQTMVAELTASPMLQLLCGLIELTMGAALLIANPWVPADLLACIMKALGLFMIAEALVILVACDLYAQLWPKMLGHFQTRWALLTTLLGLASAVAGAARFS